MPDHELPLVSVAIRSYRRLPHLLELVARLQAQEYPRFEIVVIEQSAAEREAYRLARKIQEESSVRHVECDFADDISLRDGLLIGLKAVIPAGDLVGALRDEKLLTVGAGENVVRLLPPLIVTEADIDDAVSRIERVCAKFTRTAARREAV